MGRLTIDINFVDYGVRGMQHGIRKAPTATVKEAATKPHGEWLKRRNEARNKMHAASTPEEAKAHRKTYAHAGRMVMAHYTGQVKKHLSQTV